MVSSWIFCVGGCAYELHELQVTTNFSFLRGASHPRGTGRASSHVWLYVNLPLPTEILLPELFVHMWQLKKLGIRIIPACRLDLLDGPSLLAFPTDIHAYTQLSALITLGNLRAEKGECHLYKADVYQHAKGSSLCTFLHLIIK